MTASTRIVACVVCAEGDTVCEHANNDPAVTECEAEDLDPNGFVVEVVPPKHYPSFEERGGLPPPEVTSVDCTKQQASSTPCLRSAN